MLIGIVSDTHSRYETVAKAVQILRERNVDMVLHCGDIEDQETVLLFLGLRTHYVFGNCDSDKTGLHRTMQDIGATLHDRFGHMELRSKKIAFLHGHDQGLMKQVEWSDYYDFLFYGHTHHAEEHRTGRTRVINPGALHRARPKTFVVLELPGGKLESVSVV